MTRKPIHIVHIIPSLTYGGAERSVVNLVSASRTADIRYSIISLSANTPLASDLDTSKTPVFILPKKGKLSLHLFRDLSKLLRELKPDVVHTHLSGGDMWGRMVAHYLRIPVVTTEHNVNVHEGFLKQMMKRLLRGYTIRYIACSYAVKRFMERTYRIPSSQIRVVTYGIPLSTFTVLPPMQGYASGIEFLMLGRLEEQKGHRIALEALSRLRDTSWHLTMVGEGSLQKEVERDIREKKLEDKVTITHPVSDITPFLSRAQVVLMPSLWEGFGIVGIETMAAGRVFIASAVGGLQELVQDQKTGFLVTPKDSAALHEMISYVLAHEAESLRIAHEAREYVKTQYDVSAMVRAYEDVYREVVKVS